MYEISEKFSGAYSNSVPAKKSSTGNQTFLNHKSKSSQPNRLRIRLSNECNPVATITPRGLPARGPRSAPVLTSSSKQQSRCR